MPVLQPVQPRGHRGGGTIGRLGKCRNACFAAGGGCHEQHRPRPGHPARAGTCRLWHRGEPAGHVAKAGRGRRDIAQRHEVTVGNIDVVPITRLEILPVELRVVGIEADLEADLLARGDHVEGIRQVVQVEREELAATSYADWQRRAIELARQRVDVDVAKGERDQWVWRIREIDRRVGS
jgi:hypothetical protein